MANDDDGVTGETSYDPASKVPGVRRSTYTPPTESTSLPSSSELIHDDDELANALAAEMGRLATGSFAAVRVEPEPEVAPEPAPEPEPELPAWMSLPAPDPAQAVVLPEGPPQRVVNDPELLGLLERAGLEPGGTLSVIEQLEAQLQGRGPVPTPPPSTELPVAHAEPVPPIDSFVSPETPLAAWPMPNFDEVPAPALPAWDVPPPSADWAPGPEFGIDEPKPAVEPEAVTEPEALVEPEPTPEPPRSPFAPPPLVEPPPFGGVPVLPSEAAGHAPISSLPIPDYGVEPELEEVIEAEVVEDEPTRPVPPSASADFSFDDLLADGADEELRAEPGEGAPFERSGAAAEELPVSASEGVSLDTDSISVIDRSYEEELDDDVDETDRAFAWDAGGAAAISPPSGPISTVRIPEDELVLLDNQPVRLRAFSLEASGLEPTPVDQRIGRASRLFWLWFAANSSILSIGLGAAIFGLGMSLRQSVVAVLAGVALSFIPLGLTTLAGKRSGQPTMVVSRATFGLVGNVVPAGLALITRVFWGAVLLWLLASAVAVVLVGAELDGGLGERQLMLITLGAALLVSLLIGFAGYPLIARIQLILTAISVVLIVGLIAMTFQYIDVAAALTTPDGPWILSVTGAVLVFSFVGLVWATSGADLARYQRPSTSGSASMLWSTMGATLPTFVLIGYGALLAASDKGIASGFLLSPLDTLALMLPNWYPAPLLAAAGVSLLSGIVITLYSGGFALQAIGLRLPRHWSVVVVGVLLGGVALVLTFGVVGGVNELFRDAATTLAVPTAAWAGIFASEMMIRNRRFDSGSLLTAGGAYPTVRWGNLAGLLVITGVGFGLTSATISWLGWQGYLFGLLGVGPDSDLAGSDVGVLAALALGILLPLVIGVPAIRRQERARV